MKHRHTGAEVLAGANSPSRLGLGYFGAAEALSPRGLVWFEGKK